MAEPTTIAPPPPPSPPSAEAQAIYRGMLGALCDAGARFLVGGGYAYALHTGIYRETKDFDIFVVEADLPMVSDVLRRSGAEVELFAPHWLAKARRDGVYMDVIYSSGNGIATVDEAWFTHAPTAEVMGLPVLICPVEEMIWSKAFIMERERFDGADVVHLIHEQGHRLDWDRLRARFGDHWRVLLAHLTLFGFVYPQRRGCVPDPLVAELTRRLRREQRQPPPRMAVCLGALLSRSQYIVDVQEWGYRDGRLPPDGRMTHAEIDHWERRRREDEKKTGGHRPDIRPEGSDESGGSDVGQGGPTG
jgi:hypothetical protein